MANRPLLLQVCIPFCVKQCAYCDYPYCRYDPAVLRAYQAALLAEIDSCEGEYIDREVAAISIEGGSPALLGADALFQVIQRIRKVFPCANDLQISLQTMPGDYSRALMEKMRDAGVNHWIIGLQTTRAAEHEWLERPYRYDAMSMVDLAIRTFHPQALSFDLLAGIPGQTQQSLKQSLEHCLYYAPDHMSVYPLRIPAGSRLVSAAGSSVSVSGSSASVSGSDLLSENAQILCDYACNYLKEYGFIRYTAYDYAREGHVHRYRLMFLQGFEYLGLGYHAESFVDGVMWKNGISLQKYLDHSAEFDVIATDLVRPDDESIRKIREQRSALLYPLNNRSVTGQPALNR